MVRELIAPALPPHAPPRSSTARPRPRDLFHGAALPHPPTLLRGRAQGGRPQPPNSERAAPAYVRCLSSHSTLHASVIALNRSSASALPFFASGCHFPASSP